MNESLKFSKMRRRPFTLVRLSTGFPILIESGVVADN